MAGKHSEKETRSAERIYTGRPGAVLVVKLPLGKLDIIVTFLDASPKAPIRNTSERCQQNITNI